MERFRRSTANCRTLASTWTVHSRNTWKAAVIPGRLQTDKTRLTLLLGHRRKRMTLDKLFLVPFSSFSSPLLKIHHSPHKRDYYRELHPKKLPNFTSKKENRIRYRATSPPTVSPPPWLIRRTREQQPDKERLLISSGVCIRVLACALHLWLRFLFSPLFFALSFNIVAEAPDSIICEVRIYARLGAPAVVVGHTGYRYRP